MRSKFQFHSDLEFILLVLSFGALVCTKESSWPEWKFILATAVFLITIFIWAGLQNCFNGRCGENLVFVTNVAITGISAVFASEAVYAKFNSMMAAGVVFISIYAANFLSSPQRWEKKSDNSHNPRLLNH